MGAPLTVSRWKSFFSALKQIDRLLHVFNVIFAFFFQVVWTILFWEFFGPFHTVEHNYDVDVRDRKP